MGPPVPQTAAIVGTADAAPRCAQVAHRDASACFSISRSLLTGRGQLVPIGQITNALALTHTTTSASP